MMFVAVKRTAQIQFLPCLEQANALRQTLLQANAACQAVSDTAWDTRIFRQYDLHHRCYRSMRERFGLSAQLTLRAIAKVANAYKLDRKTKHLFSLLRGITFE